MLFNSFHFLFFFPCVLLLYYILPFRFRKHMLLLASCYFYMCWKPEFIILVLISTAIDYYCSNGIEKYRATPSMAKMLLAISLCSNLGLLFFFKYFNFFGETLTSICHAVSIPFSMPVLNIILPVGISFYTFQTMSYTIDVYRGKMHAEKDFISFALYVSFFPQLVAGPIEKATNLLPQLKKEHSFSYENLTYGLKLMAWGFFKKLVVADQMATLFVDPVYQNPSNYSGGALFLATMAFAIQIYCDFGGYSDIARGCAKTMGIDLMINFKAPYLATSVTDFWRRWHISLTNWFREYVYIPLGGNRNGLGRTLMNTTLTFFLSGLWHGASWTFILWGLLQALYLNIERLIRVNSNQSSEAHTTFSLSGLCKRVLCALITFFLCSFSWVFFRANSMADALYIVQNFLSGISSPIQYMLNSVYALYPGHLGAAISLFSLAVLFLFDITNERKDPICVISRLPFAVRQIIYTIFLLVLILLIPKESTAPFIYFQF